MKLVLLNQDFDVSKIRISTEDVFQHLKDFLFEDSKDYISSKLCSIYALEIDNFIRGYISFSASIVKINPKYFSVLGGKIKDLEGIGFPIPCMLIGKLLIDKDLRGFGYGKSLLSFAISSAFELSKMIGVRFIVVDANNKSVGFYEKSGFISIESNNNTTKMLFDLKVLDYI